LKFVLSPTQGHVPVDAILFFADQTQLKTNYQTLQIHYELDVNVFRGQENLQLLILQIF